MGKHPISCSHHDRIRRACGIVFTLIGLTPLLAFGAPVKISLPIGPGITRADIYVESYSGEACGTLILCPGSNGNGEELLKNPKWIKFADEEKLNLVGLSFASNDNPDGRGYFDVSSGSGQLLLDGLQRAFGAKQTPLLLYGFSRGAQFTYSFTHWKPELVLVWCAYSATEWKDPDKNIHEPKGIIACGEDDESNYSFATLQFLKGRSMAEPWTWVSLEHQGHAWSSALDNFVRVYFASVLANPRADGIWLDVDNKNPVSLGDLREHPTLASWLPDKAVAAAWKEIHQQ